MCKRLNVWIALIVVGGFLGQASAELVGHWKLDDGAGTVAEDSSGNGHHGEVTGTPVWVEGMIGGALEFSGSPDKVDIPPSEQLNPTEAFTACLWAYVAPGSSGYRSPLTSRDEDPLRGYLIYAHTNGLWSYWTGKTGGWDALNGPEIITGEWTHVAATFDRGHKGLYVNGELTIEGDSDYSPNTERPLRIGAGATETDGSYYFTGRIDDVGIFDHAMAVEEIQAAMLGIVSAKQASVPTPVDEETDVVRYTEFGWTAGKFAATHDVYLGTSFDDVNDATRQNPMGVLVSQGQSRTAYESATLLEYGQDYFWRVDEVNDAPDYAIFKGEVWTFTVEPFAYAVENIVATSNAVSVPDQGPDKTIDGSGLDEDDRHSMAAEDMWVGTPDGDDPVYLQYDLGRTYQLYQMLVWNYNIQFESVLGYGLKDITIETSTDGETWTVFGDLELAKGASSPDYVPNTTIDFGGVAGRYVRLTAGGTWGGGDTYGLSEVRFLYTPVQARKPQPEDRATEVAITDSLSWRVGREAVTHEVHMGPDPNAMALAGVTGKNSYAPENLELSTTYYWRVDEVNEAEAVTTWAGDLWTFTTEECIVIDNFESYIDDPDAGDVIWEVWVDGWVEEGGDPDNGGSQVGNTNSPFAEQTTVHGGRQAMPLYFNADASGMAEADYPFATAQDWMAHGVKSLSVWIYGDPGNTGQVYVKINDTKLTSDFMATAIALPQWTQWTIDLSGVDPATLQQVTSLSIGVDNPGDGGLLLVDDICLYAYQAETIEPVTPDDNDPNLMAYYTLDGTVADSKGNYTGESAGDPVYVDGYNGQAMYFNGVTDEVVCSLADEEVWPGYTLSLWARTDTFGQVVYSSLFNNNSSSGDFQLDVDGGDPGRYRYRGSATRFFGPVVSDWVHLGITCDGALTVLYFNGQATDSADVADVRFGQIAIGINRNGAYPFEGTIDEVRLYDRALTDAEMAGLAGVTAPMPKPF